MAVLGIAWLVIAIVILTTDVNGSASIALVGTLFALWAILLVEYLVRLVVTPDRRGYLRRRWVEPATVVVPPLQGWHLVGIEKMSLLVHEGELRVEAILKHHSLFRVLIAAAGDPLPRRLAGAALRGERQGEQHPQLPRRAVVGHRHRDHRGLRRPVPRAPAAAGRWPWSSCWSGSASSACSPPPWPRCSSRSTPTPTRRSIKKGHADLGQQLAVISDRLADVERRLGATPAEVAAMDAAADAEAAADGPVEPDPEHPPPERDEHRRHEGDPHPRRHRPPTPPSRASNRPRPAARSSGSISTSTIPGPTTTSRAC